MPDEAQSTRGKPIFASAPHSVSDQEFYEQNARLQGTERFRKYRMMLDSDGRVSGAISAFFMPILAATWSLDWGESEPTDAMRDYAKTAFLDGWTGGWLEQVLEYQPFGSLAVQPGWSRGADGLFWPKLYIRHPETWDKFETDSAGHITALSLTGYQGDQSKTLTIPLEELTFFVRRRRSHNDFMGQAMLRPAWESWRYKHNLFVVDGIDKERFATGTPTAITSSDADKPALDELETALQNLRSHERGYLIISEDVLADRPDALRILEKTGSSTVKESVDMHNDEMMTGMLAQWLNLGVGETGARAVGTIHLELALKQSKAVAVMAGETFSTGDDWNGPGVIQQGMALNFGQTAPVPVLRATGIDDMTAAELKDFVVAFAGAGLVTHDEDTENWIRNRVGAPAKTTENIAPSQDSALNGAQVTALQGILEAVAAGTIPRESAIAVLVGSFPFDEQRATEMVGQAQRTDPANRLALASIFRTERLRHADDLINDPKVAVVLPPSDLTPADNGDTVSLRKGLREPTAMESRVLALADMVEIREQNEAAVKIAIDDWVAKTRDSARTFLEPLIVDHDFDAIQAYQVRGRQELVDILTAQALQSLREGRREVAEETQRQIDGTSAEEIVDEVRASEPLQKDLAFQLSSGDPQATEMQLATGGAISRTMLAACRFQGLDDWKQSLGVVQFADGDPLDTSSELARINAKARVAADKIANEIRDGIVDAAISAASQAPADLDIFDALVTRGGIRSTADAAAAVVGFGVAAGRALGLNSEITAGGEAFRFSEFVYSAILDRNTCKVCGPQDGTRAEERSDLVPVPNPDCEGTPALCRCLHIGVIT